MYILKKCLQLKQEKYKCMHDFMYVSNYLCMHVSNMYVCSMYVCMYVCMYAYKFISLYYIKKLFRL